MEISWRILVLVVLGHYMCYSVWGSSLQCKNENDEPVDWYVAIKLPRLKKSCNNSNVQNGVAYVFITSSTVNESWTLSNRTVDDFNSIMGHTFKPLYNDKISSFARLLYNDEPPGGNTTMTLGHTKGVVVGDHSSGFWMIHSVPHFPPQAVNKAYSYPKTGKLYGQSFLCISLPPKDLEIIGQQLIFNEPYLYDADIPEALREIFPSFVRVAQEEHRHSPPWYNAATISSLAGISFTSFAKSKHFGKDLYADWVAQHLEADLEVETWNHGPGARIQSECNKPFKVENIKGVMLDQISYSTGEDHSKWAVSSTIGKSWVCIGDINRMEHQKQRGEELCVFKMIICFMLIMILSQALICVQLEWWSSLSIKL